MNLTYVTFAAIEKSHDGRLTSPAASARYRVLIPAEQLVRRGHQVEVATTNTQFWASRRFEALAGETVIFSKSFDERNEQAVEWLKKAGKRIVLDICDNPFEQPKLGSHFMRLATQVDTLIASTPTMADVIREKTGRDAVVIGDPVEGRMRQAAFCPRFPRIRLLWFGHPVNLDFLYLALPSITKLSERYPFELEIVTEVIPQRSEIIAQWNREAGKVLPISLTQWSLESARVALDRCDIVLIPSLLDKQKNVKSANRLVESLWAGRCVVASPVPAYLDYADYAWLGPDLAAGLQEVIENPSHWENRIGQAQRVIATTLLPYHIANDWEHALGVTRAQPVKLNLGCGDKILPGFVNVDVVESRRGERPDLLCDLHKLTPFPDNSVDEILSVHVVEHFWRWEVLDVLKEWVRVLKPGATMILECPNLESACRTFLKDPVAYSREDQQGQRSMWVFYGDPAWRDPYMIHRWGYTAQSLAELMRQAGLAQVRQEPAQFKLREPRDMRVVGVKP